MYYIFIGISEENDKLRSMNTLFQEMLYNRKFMVTSYKRFQSNNNKIDNYIPIQVDNTKPVEIVIHLYKEVDDFETNSSPNNSIHIVKCINEEKNAEKSRNLTALLKNALENKKNTVLTTNRRASLTTSPSPKSAKIDGDEYTLESSGKNSLDFNLMNVIETNTEVNVEMGPIVNANLFYLHPTKWEKRFEEICRSMEKDYESCGISEQFNINSSHSLPYISLNLTPKKIEEKLIQIGLACAYVNKVDRVYRRVLVVETLKKKSAEVKVFLFDLGTYLNVNIEDLFNLLDKYSKWSPLCFECTLNLKMSRPELDDQVTLQFKKLVNLNKNFKIKLINKLKNLKPKSKENECITINRYHVNLFGTRAEPYDPSTELVINFGDELKSFGSSLSTRKLIAPISPPINCALWDKLAEKTIAFNETEMPLGEILKIKLINLSTVTNFSVILRFHQDRRQEFLTNLHHWHKENRKNLISLFDKPITALNMKSYIGLPCALRSVQMGKWCRGLIVELSQLAHIYLVDYGELLFNFDLSII